MDGSVVDSQVQLHRSAEELRSSQIAGQMKRLVEVKKLEVNGSMFIKVGLCEQEVRGERYAIGNSLKSKLVHIVFW
jgi:hypothetical protein